ncbi:MAG: hypothetical protein WD738_04190 [Pirellulales bacterium]
MPDEIIGCVDDAIKISIGYQHGCRIKMPSPNDIVGLIDDLIERVIAVDSQFNRDGNRLLVVAEIEFQVQEGVRRRGIPNLPEADCPHRWQAAAGPREHSLGQFGRIIR